MLFRFSGKPVNEAELIKGLKRNFQFSKILLKPGLAIWQHKLYVQCTIDSISCYSNDSVPIIINYSFNRAIQIKLVKWAKLTTESRNPLESGKIWLILGMKQNLQKDRTKKEGFLKRKNFLYI